MRKKKTQKEFISEVKSIHPELTVLGTYINNGTKVLIKDSLDIEYMTYPGNLLKGKKPTLNSATNKTQAFKIILKEKQPNLTVLGEYIDGGEKILVADNIGIEYMMQPKKLIFGDSPSVKSAKDFNQAFKIKSEVVHGENKYDYSLVDYLANDKKVKIFCKTCDIYFLQNPSSHLNGCGCPSCKIEKLKSIGAVKIQRRAETIIKDIIKIHGDKINLDKFIYTGAHKKSTFGCGINKSHDYWDCIPNNILQGKGCPSCRLSKGERCIEEILIENNIEFEKQHKFVDCKNKLALPFDFYLPTYNICIEFNGRQHYEPVAAFGGDKSFKQTRINDKIKKEYCNKKDIQLITIPFTKLNNIKLELNHFLFTKTT